MATVAEIYRLAGYIYLQRMGRGGAGTSEKLKWLVDRLLLRLTRLSCASGRCRCLFIALEARTDDERLAVLDILARSREKLPLGNLPLTEIMVRAAWAQQDLMRARPEWRCATFSTPWSAQTAYRHRLRRSGHLLRRQPCVRPHMECSVRSTHTHSM